MEGQLRDSGPTCDAVRVAVCELAAGGTLGDRAGGVARHVKGCPACDAFVDELAELRSWLDALPLPGTRPVGARRLRRLAREALARELQARLARDLLVLVQGGEPRSEAAVTRDGARLLALRGAGARGREPWGAALEILAAGRCPDRDRTLHLAACLDPVGLDVALAWLGQLARAGQGQRARSAAERLLEEVP